MPDELDPDAAAEQILRTAEAGAIESEARDESRRKAARREQAARDDLVLATLHGLEDESPAPEADRAAAPERVPAAVRPGPGDQPALAVQRPQVGHVLLAG